LLLTEDIENTYNPEASGNNFLYHLLDAEKIKVIPGSCDVTSELRHFAEDTIAEGRKPYVIPLGVSTPLGTLGYVSCAQEIMEQNDFQGLDITHVICASGSGGTQAGLITGFHNSNIVVMGINVLQRNPAQVELVHGLAQKNMNLIDADMRILTNEVNCFDDYLGPGYTMPTKEMIEAVKLLARTEGILLDPVYTGKAMAGLIGLIKKGYFKKENNILFLHTGGTPTLYSSMNTILNYEMA
jgi:D-cysteine desulfhydrase